MKTLKVDLQSRADVITSFNSNAVPLNTGNYAKGVGVLLNVLDTTPAAATFTAVAATDLCTAASHGFVTGLLVRGTTTTTLPAGLALATDYFVIKVSANTFKLASSLVNALAGTAIDITSAGTGVHTLTPTALAYTYGLEASVDEGVTWTSLGTPVAKTASFQVVTQALDPMYSAIRGAYIVTAGKVTVTQNSIVKGE